LISVLLKVVLLIALGIKQVRHITVTIM